MSYTPQRGNDRTPPPKTPGWTRGLFGILSTSKKSVPVDAGRHDTGVARLPSSASRRRVQIDMTPPRDFLSDNARVETKQNEFPSSGLDTFAAGGSTTATNTRTNSAFGGQAAMSPREGTIGQAYNAGKSPWKSPAWNGRRGGSSSAIDNGGVRFSVGTIKSKSMRKEAPIKSTRKKPYRRTPLCVPRNATRKRINPIVASEVLGGAKGLFTASTQQIEARNSKVYFRAGKRLLGSNQRAGRLLPPMQTDDSAGGNSSRTQVSAVRQDRVTFESTKTGKDGVRFKDAGKPLEMTLATPKRKEFPRGATPFKPAPNVEETSVTSNTSSVRKSPRRSFLPRPRLHFSIEPGDVEFDDEDDDTLELGEPARGDMKDMFRFDMPNMRGPLPTETLKSFGAPKQASPKGIDSIQPTKEVPDVDPRSTKRTRTGWGDTFASQSRKWKCPACYVQNELSAKKCAACEAPRPGHEDEAKSGSSSAAPSGAIGASGFIFGTATSATNDASSKGAFTAGGFQFGTATTSTSQSTKTAVSTSGGGGGGFKFGAGASSSSSAPSGETSATGFSFGGGSSEKQGTKNGVSAGFTLGGTAPAPSPAPSTTQQKSSGFVFGATAQKTTTDPAPSDPAKAPVFSFGNSGSSTSNLPKANGDDSKLFKTASVGAASDKKDEAPKLGFSFPTSTSASGGKAAGTLPTPPLGSIKTAPRTEPKPKRGRPVDDGSDSLPVSASKIPSISFQGSKPPQSATDKPATSGFNFGGGSALAAPITFGGGKPPAAESAAAAPPSSAPSAKPMFSFGTAPETSSLNSASSSASTNVPTATIPLGSIPGKSSDERSKKRRNGDGKLDPSLPLPGLPEASAAKTSQPAPFSFGAGASSSGQPNSSSLFGSAPPFNGVTTQPAVAPPTFGSKPAAAENPPASSSGFGSTAPTPAPSAQAPASGFGSTASAPTFTFGSTPAPATQPPSDTGASKPASSIAPTFGGAPTPAPAAPPAPLFGSAPAPAAPQPAPAAGTNPFGTAPAPAPPAPGFTFGSGQPSTSAPTFGAAPAAPSAPPAFGAAPANAPASGPSFGSTPAAPSTFGSGPAPAPFGAAPAPAPFGAAAPAPFGSAHAQPPTFGSAPAPAPFGSTPAPAPFGSSAAAAPFGTAPAPAPFGAPVPAPSFGAAPAPAPFGSTSAPAPFGSTPAPAPFGGGHFGAPAAAPTSGFGGFGAAPPGPAPGGFSTPQQSGFGGFGGGPNTAPPNMGMNSGAPQFSIGTGGSKPPGTRRRIKARRPGGTRPA